MCSPAQRPGDGQAAGFTWGSCLARSHWPVSFIPQHRPHVRPVSVLWPRSLERVGASNTLFQPATNAVSHFNSDGLFEERPLTLSSPAAQRHRNPWLIWSAAPSPNLKLSRLRTRRWHPANLYLSQMMDLTPRQTELRLFLFYPLMENTDHITGYTNPQPHFSQCGCFIKKKRGLHFPERG